MKKELTLQDIQDSIGDLKNSMDEQFTKVEEQFTDLHEAINAHSSEMDRQFSVIHSTIATKDFVTEKLGELRGEFFSSGKRPTRRAKVTA